MEPPERPFWPLPPEPEVLPWPLPSPQPTRFLRCTAPLTLTRLWRRIFLIPKFGAARRIAPDDSDYYWTILSAEGLEVFREAQLAQAIERRVDDGDVVLRTHRLGEDVVDAGRFEDRADTAAGDEAGTGGSGAKEDLAAVVLAEDLVRDRAALELHGNHTLLGGLGGLLDGVGDLVGLAVAGADVALAVADDGECGEAEATSALHDLGATVDEDDLLDQAGLGFLAGA